MEQIVFIARHGDISIGIGAMKRGAVDFLPKPFRDDELLSAVAQALARSAEVAEARARLSKLTPREFEVFRLVIAGLVNKEIGAELGVTLRTIKEHRGRVMQKIGVLSVAELLWLALKPGVALAPAENLGTKPTGKVVNDMFVPSREHGTHTIPPALYDGGGDAGGGPARFSGGSHRRQERGNCCRRGKRVRRRWLRSCRGQSHVFVKGSFARRGALCSVR